MTPHVHMPRIRPGRPAAILAAGIALVPGGCYRHVVEVRGGQSNVPVHESNIGPGESVWSDERPKPKPRPAYETVETVDFPGRTP